MGSVFNQDGHASRSGILGRFVRHHAMGRAVCALALLVVSGHAVSAQGARPGLEIADDEAARVARLASEARQHLDTDDLIAAREGFRVLRSIAPDDERGLLGLAEVHLKLGDADLAGAYARAARRRSPLSSEAAAMEVRALLRARHFDSAVRVSRAALESVPEPGASLWAAHASALFRVQKTDEAADAYRKVVEIEPLHPEAHVRLGSGLIAPGPAPLLPELDAAVGALRDGDLSWAITLLSGVVNEHENHAIAHRLLGEALLDRAAQRSMVSHSPEFQRLRAALPTPEVDATVVEKFMPAFGALSPERRRTARRALAIFSSYLPRLVAMGGRHDLLLELERTTQARARASLRGKRTFDGRVWDDVRGIGGLKAATGIEALDACRHFGFDTLAHEIAHQAHLYGFRRVDRLRIRDMYESAKEEDRFLDYYAANNEAEYFGQGIEAFVSLGKRPGREPTHGHTRFELYRVDRKLYDFIAKRVDYDPLRDPELRATLLPIAADLAMASGRPEDAVVAANMMDAGPERDALRERARRAALAARAY